MSSNLAFGDTPVSADAIMQLYRMAWHYSIRRWHMRASDEDVRDAVQEAVAYTSACMSRGLYDPSKGSWGKWAYMYIKSKCTCMLEQIAGRRAMQADYDVGWLSLPDDDHGEPMDDDEYIATLPDQYRELAARLLRGDTLVSIARDEGVTHQAIYARKMRLGEWIRGHQDGDN